MTTIEYLKKAIDNVVLQIGITSKVMPALSSVEAMQIGATMIFTIMDRELVPDKKLNEPKDEATLLEFLNTGSFTYHGVYVSLQGAQVTVLDKRQ